MSNIYNGKKFFGKLEQERARTDRNGQKFSILILKMANSKDCESFVRYCSYVLEQRVRSYDVIGRIDKHRIGVLLPDTEADGARQVADDVCRTIIPRSQYPEYKVFTYPLNDVSGLKSEPNGSSEGEEGLTVEAGAEQGSEKLWQELNAILPRRIPIWKRMMDLLFAIFVLAIVSPAMLLIGIFIKIVSPGPVFFKQERVGYRGEPFTCYKFRTMTVEANTSVHHKHFSDIMGKEIPMVKLDGKDSRIILGGVLLRNTGLDELPQLFNVIRGEMSLVGPRPCIPYEAQQFLNWQNKRFATVPGLTGLWQVSGKNKTTFNEMIRFDISYTHKKSILLDIKIYLKTIPAIVTQVVDKKRGSFKSRKMENKKAAMF